MKNHSKHKCLAFVAVLLCMLLAADSNSQIYSVGPKVGYRFGSGWEGGFELSYVAYKIPSLFGGDSGPTAFYGFTFDLTPIGKTKSVHIGVEGFLGPFGVDVGPSFFWSSGHSAFGFSLIPFIGFGAYPFYELDFYSKNDSLITDKSLGLYLKFPISD